MSCCMYGVGGWVGGWVVDLVFGVVGNVGVGVEKLANAVAAVGLDHGAALRRSSFADHLANVSIHSFVGLKGSDGSRQAIKGTFHQLSACLIDVTHKKGLIKVAVVAFVKSGDVDVDNVPILKLAHVWNTVTNDLFF